MPSKTPFIDPTTARQAYEESRKWIRIYDEPMDELERLARNRPSLNIDPSLPKVTDGTLAAVVQETPKRIVQQIPTSLVYSDENLDYAAVADVVFTDKLLPLYAVNGTLIQKSWNMLSKAMTYGSSYSYTFFTGTNPKDMHVDFTIPYIKDVLPERGKTYAPDGNIQFLRAWYSKRDLKGIINREKARMAADKKYTSPWDLVMLAAFISADGEAKPAEFMTPAEKEKGDGYAGGYEIIHAFQRGIGAEYYSFAPRYKDGQNLRTKVNNDPRGKLPLDALYCNIDLSNPRGRGSVELSGGVQNLIDQQMQLFQFMTTYFQAPALKVWGNVNKATLKIKPGAIWDMGSSPNNKVERDVPENAILTEFPNNYGLLKSQIMNLNNNQDHSVSAKQAPNSQSKTHAGVQAQEQQLGVSDNYLRKQYEAWFRSQSETAVNIYFSEMKGNEQIPLNQLQVDDLLASPAAKFVKKDAKTGKSSLNVTYDDIDKVVFNMQVDAGTSEEQDDDDQLQKMETIMQEVGQNPLVINWFLGLSGKKLQMGELYAQRFERMKLKNLDSILVDMDEKEAEQAKQAPFPILDKPQVRLMGKDLPPAALVGALHQAGVEITMQDAMVAPIELQHKSQTDLQLKQMDSTLASHPRDMSETINIGDIYKDPRTPATILAQIQALAGLTPDEQETQNLIDTSETQHAADQATHHQQAVEAVRNILQPQTPSIDPNSPEAQNAKADAAIKIANESPQPATAGSTAKKPKKSKVQSQDTVTPQEVHATRASQTTPEQPQEVAATPAAGTEAQQQQMPQASQPQQPEQQESPQQEQQESPQQEEQEIEQNFAADPLTSAEQQEVMQMLQQGMTEEEIEQIITQRRQQQGQVAPHA